VDKLPLISEQLVICLTGSVAVYVFQSIIESIATLISRFYLGWGSAENAILFAGIGVLAVVGYSLTVVSSFGLFQTYKIAFRLSRYSLRRD
jgi:hypothetical protein